MRLPGFVAEASLFSAPALRRTNQHRSQPRNSGWTSGAVKAQGPLRIEEPAPRFFLSTCRQRCEAGLRAARVQCLGRCASFVGGGSPLFGACVSTCLRGEDFYREQGIDNPSNIMAAPPELKSGYCDVRCLRASPIPHFFGP